jgi:hypothetical protein
LGVIDITKVLTPIEHLIPKIEPEVPILDIQQEDKKEEQIKEQTGSIATDQSENPIDSLTDIYICRQSNKYTIIFYHINFYCM